MDIDDRSLVMAMVKVKRVSVSGDVTGHLLASAKGRVNTSPWRNLRFWIPSAHARVSAKSDVLTCVQQEVDPKNSRGRSGG